MRKQANFNDHCEGSYLDYFKLKLNAHLTKQNIYRKDFVITKFNAISWWHKIKRAPTGMADDKPTSLMSNLV